MNFIHEYKHCMQLHHDTQAQCYRLAAFLYHAKFTLFQVSTDGTISLLLGFIRPFVPLTSLTTHPLIVPLWLLDSRILIKSLHHRIAYDAATLNQVVNLISAENSDLEEFRPSLAAIITWVNHGPDISVSFRCRHVTWSMILKQKVLKGMASSQEQC